MGQQVNFYLNADEDRVVTEYLGKRGAACIPENCDCDKPLMVTAEQCRERRVRIVLPRFADLVYKSMITPNDLFWRLTRDGVSIEWERCIPNTSKGPSYSGVPVYTEPGRIYFRSNDRDTEVVECSAQLDRLYDGLARLIRGKCRKVGSYFIGNALLEESREGKAKLFHQNQVTPIETIGQPTESSDTRAAASQR